MADLEPVVAELDRRLPEGWRVGAIRANDLEYSVILYRPDEAISPETLKEGRGRTVELAFSAAVQQLPNADRQKVMSQMAEAENTDLGMFGDLEDAPDDRMMVRAIGHVLGTSAGWFHYDGLSVIFPMFQTTHTALLNLIQDIPPERVCLGIDFYTGEVKIIEGEQGFSPKVHHSLQLDELLKPDKGAKRTMHDA